MNAHNCELFRKGMKDQAFIPLAWDEISPVEMKLRSKQLLESMRMRRTTRHFSTRDVPKELIEQAILCGGTAPSGAHLQPVSYTHLTLPTILRV